LTLGRLPALSFDSLLPSRVLVRKEIPNDGGPDARQMRLLQRDSLGLLGLVLLDLALNLVLIFERRALGCPARHGYLIGASTCQRSTATNLLTWPGADGDYRMLQLSRVYPLVMIAIAQTTGILFNV
jgi:hypothetical protein